MSTYTGVANCQTVRFLAHPVYIVTFKTASSVVTSGSRNVGL